MIKFRKLIPVILCCSLCANLAAQSSVVDSLEHRLASFAGSNFEKGWLMLEISQEYRLTDTLKSKSYIMQALDLAQKTGEEKVEGYAYLLLGTYYTFLGQEYLAFLNDKKAEKLFLKLNDKVALYKVYYNLINQFHTLGDMDNVSYYADKILEIDSAGQYDLTSIISSETMITTKDQEIIIETILWAQYLKGLANFKDNEGQEMLDYFVEMFHTLFLLNPESPVTMYIANQCGRIFLLQNRPGEALYYLHWVRVYFEKQILYLPQMYASLAEAHAMLNRLDSANHYIKKAMNAPAHLMDNEAMMILYRSQSLIASKKGNYRSALESFKKYHHLSDSTVKVKKTNEILRMRNWHELEQKDTENELLQQEKQKQQMLINILAGTLVMILALLALSLFFYRKMAGKNREWEKLHTVKDKLFSVVAHDLRNPMSALITVLKLADNNMLDAEQQAHLLKDISIKVDYTFSLLDNLLRWAKSQMQGIVPSPVYFNIQDETRTVVDSLGDIAAAKMVTLNNCIEDQMVYADRDLFSVVIRNLTTNAIKYSSADGVVSLASELSGDMHTLIVSVKDTGTGISQPIQKQLFKLSEARSRRGTNNESGAGLGLVLCADFVKINGGNIWYTSKVGEGSTFYFTIPVRRNTKTT